MNKEKLSNTDQIKEFVKTNHDYYINEFERIGNSSKYVLSFNISAFLLGSIWYSFRNIWNWSLAFLIIETFAIVQVARGLFGNRFAPKRVGIIIAVSFISNKLCV